MVDCQYFGQGENRTLAGRFAPMSPRRALGQEGPVTELSLAFRLRTDRQLALRCLAPWWLWRVALW